MTGRERESELGRGSQREGWSERKREIKKKTHTHTRVHTLTHTLMHTY